MSTQYPQRYTYWPEEIKAIYRRALSALHGDWFPMHFGPGHIVWEDENFDCAVSCLRDFDTASKWCDYSPEELEIVRQSLEELAVLPPDIIDMPMEISG